jgi:hypothetical protein
VVEVSLHGDDVVFRMLRSHKLWALRSEIRVPRAHILDVRREEPESPFLKGWVNIGTFMPGVILAGSFHVRGKWHFYDVVDLSKTVVVDLQNERFERLSVQVADPDAVVRLLKGSAEASA